MVIIAYKAKPFDVQQGKDSKEVRRAINFKQTIGRSDCNLKPHEHAYYNSDLFVGMLNRAYKGVLGEYRTFIGVKPPSWIPAHFDDGHICAHNAKVAHI